MKKGTKKLSWLLAASMSVSMLPVFGTAQAAAPTDVKLKGRYETGIPLKVEYQADAGASIQWEISDNGTDGWTAIAGATSASYTPDRGKGLKWIRAAVTSDGSTVYSEPKQMKARWYGKLPAPADGREGKLASDTANGVIYAMKATAYRAESNADDIFTIDDAQYLLLDTTEDDESHFLIMRKEAVGNHTVSDGQQRMAEVMCWLNDKASIEIFANNSSKGMYKGGEDYTNNGYRADMEAIEPKYAAISEKLMRHVDENAVWKQEPKMWVWGNAEITYSGGLTIPSMTDYERYVDKIGWKDFVAENTSTYMAFRTGHGNSIDSGDKTATYATEWATGTTFANDARVGKNAYAIRPMFFLDKDFFMDAEIVEQMDFNTIGSNIKYAIANSAPMSELVAAGYNEADLAPYEESLGELSEITTDGLFETSLPMTLKYTYEGNELRLKFNMYVSDAENGEFTLIETKTGNNVFNIPVSAGGKYIKFSAETPDGIVKETEAHYVNTAWGRDGGINSVSIGKELNCTDGTTIVMKDLDTKNETTPQEYVFSIDGMDFIMLDVTESDSSKFFVMSKNIVDGEAVNFSTGGQLMDTMMDFLNSTNGVEGYMPNGSYEGRTDADGMPIDIIFPDDILQNINYNQVWKVERKMWEDATERTVTGGITFPAMHEIRQYSNKIGIWDDKVDWWTRTPLGTQTAGGDTTLYSNSDSLGAFFATKGSAATRKDIYAHIRPVFYLDKSMFTDKVYDLSEFGIEVLSAIRKAYTRDELAEAGYSESDLQKYYDVEGELTSAEIKGIYETSLPVKVDFAYDGSNLDNIKINWYVSDTIDGEYKSLGSVSGKDNNFRIPYSAGGKYIKGEAVCIPTGTSFMTEARYVEPLWGPQAAINEKTVVNEETGRIEGAQGETYPYNSIKDRMPVTTPAEYTFEYDGKEYILLDTTESDESHYLVMLKTPEVKHVFNKNSNGGQTFNDLIGWLNDLDVVNGYAEEKDTSVVTSYKGSGYLSANPLPKAITSHINWSNNWKVERKMWDDRYERVYEGGIAIPAYKELERYAEKIGIYDAGFAQSWLRTPDGKKGGDGNCVLASASAQEFAGYFNANNIGMEYYIRPIFYLDKDFFTSVRVEGIGTETASLIREDVPKADMIASGLYTDAEIEEIYKENVPVEEDYVKAEFTNVKEGGTVTAAVKTNIYSDTQWAFIAAVYNKDGKLLGVNFEEHTPNPDSQTKVYSFDMTVPNVAAGDGNYAKLFVWDYCVDDMYPLFEAIK